MLQKKSIVSFAINGAARQIMTTYSQLTGAQNLLLSTFTVGIRVDAIDSIDTVIERLMSAMHQKQPWLMTFANPATAILATRNAEFRHALVQFDMVAPDGIGMVMAIQMLHRRPASRISFDDTSLAPSVFKIAADQDIGVVLTGGLPGVAEIARQRLLRANPGLRIDAVFDGYQNVDAVVAAITGLARGIVIAGMGAPAQEQFLLKLAANGWSGLGFTCGGYLDQLSLKGTSYYPAWVDRYNVRWAYRLFMEPKRLWRRYLIDYPQFGMRLCGSLLRVSRSG
jgi:N-acetylglucosaminyldiphosphoundecaprenol N-acetyl-beta-D-mannosaminyltransferase